jgi:RNA polymerase sigma factor (sigma-70 family)
VLRHPPRPARAHLQFPSTSWDLLAAASRTDQPAAALDEFVERYYAGIRGFIAAIVRQPVDADDLTQRFFEKVVLSGRLLSRADRGKGRFRPYLKQAIRNFLIDEYRRHRHSVNPDVRPDSLDDGWNGVLAESAVSPDAELLRAWARSIVSMAVARVQTICEENGQAQHFQMFVHRYLADSDRPPTWREVGEPFGLDEKVARGRTEAPVRHFRLLLRQLVASDMGSEKGVDEELQAVIAIL